MWKWWKKYGTPSLITYHMICNKRNTTGAIYEQEMPILPEHMSSPSFF
jgi:hypothetical protein